MARKGGPDNSLHNWLDMACRGFTKRAREEYLQNQRKEKEIRKGRGGHRQRRNSETPDFAATPVAVPSMQGLIPKAQNIPQGALGNGFPGLTPPTGYLQGLMNPSNARPVLQGNG